MLEIMIQFDVIKSITQNACVSLHHFISSQSVSVQNNLIVPISQFPSLPFKFSRSVNLEK